MMSTRHPGAAQPATGRRRCAFLTLEERGDFNISDHLLHAPLAKLGWDVDEIPWTRPGVDWRGYHAVVIRSCWDYQQHIDRFLDTLALIESQTLLFNPSAVCRWNCHKRYLLDLAEAGVPIVPTRCVDRLTPSEIAAAAEAFASRRLMIKPCIGANADHTFVIRADRNKSWDGALAAFRDREPMLQPFVESIRSTGEYSLFYFGGRYSHAVRKRPAAGDFRVQEEHGGRIAPCEARDALQDVAERCLAVVQEPLLYARVDLVCLPDDRPALMELELIEPSLYFDQCAAAPERFAQSFQTRVAQHRP